MKMPLVTKISLVLVLLLGAAGVASAQPMVRKVSDMNRAAMEDYDILEFDAAQKRLDEAVGLIEKNNLNDHPIAARTHMNLGIVYGGGLGDADKAVEHFGKALAIDPSIELDPAYRSPELQRLYERAKQGGGKSNGKEPDDTPDEAKGLLHNPVEEARAGKNIPIDLHVGSDVRAKSVLLFYRAEGSDAFTQVRMKALDGGNYAAQIPGEETRDASAVHYYIVAVNESGKVLASDGSKNSPHIVSIQQTGTANDPRPHRNGGKGKKGKDDDVTSDGNDTENPLDGVDGEGGRGGKPGVFLALRAGTGGGYITESTESANQPVSCCVAPALFHVAPELGFWVGPHTTLSLVARIGFPIGANIEGHATLGPAGLLRLGYFGGERGSGWNFHGDAGFGLIRQTVKLQDIPAGTMGDTDTYATGPLLLGGGTGYYVPLGRSVRLAFDLNIIMGVAVVKTLGSAVPGFGVNVDASLGLAFVL